MSHPKFSHSVIKVLPGKQHRKRHTARMKNESPYDVVVKQLAEEAKSSPPRVKTPKSARAAEQAEQNQELAMLSPAEYASREILPALTTIDLVLEEIARAVEELDSKSLGAWQHARFDDVTGEVIAMQHNTTYYYIDSLNRVMMKKWDDTTDDRARARAHNVFISERVASVVRSIVNNLHVALGIGLFAKHRNGRFMGILALMPAKMIRERSKNLELRDEEESRKNNAAGDDYENEDQDVNVDD